MDYLLNNPGDVLALVWQHVVITAIALGVSFAIALPLGFILYRFPRLQTPVMGVLGILYTIPSIALMILLLPILGLNSRSVIVALIVYCQVILVRNVLAGLNGIDPAVIEAARGMGMTSWQQAWRVLLPLAFPVIIAGVRIATVVAVAIATVGARFNGGGLGTLLFDGIAQARLDKIWAGAITVGVLALSLNLLIGLTERRVVRWTSVTMTRI
ncbi:MAG TPA: ABC transporter permease [Anaerolineaceae bacterium]|jgi:osmoprotectant transport system permease protein